MQSFYDSVLPAGSVLVATRSGETSDNSPQHYLVSGKAGLEARLEDAVTRGLSLHVALGGFADQVTDPQGIQYTPRTTTLTPVRARAIGLDLDVGDMANKYATIEAAHSAIRAAVDARQLPTPTWLVLSGGGIHLYWAFTEDVGIEQWFDIQHRFHHYARRFLQLDPGGTTRAHVLQRSPQSWNYKYDPPRKCMAYPSGNPVDAAELGDWLPAMDVPAMHSDESGPEYGVVCLNSLFFTTGCAQLARIIEHGAHSRADWIAMANASYYMTDGKDRFHQAAALYAGYDYDESEFTREEIQANATAGPWSCAKFSSGHESICEGCPARGHGAKNPVSAARMVKRQYDLQMQTSGALAMAAQAVPHAVAGVEAVPAVGTSSANTLESLTTPVIDVDLTAATLSRFFADSGTLYYQPAEVDGQFPPRVSVCRPYITIEALSIHEQTLQPGMMVRSHHAKHTEPFRLDNVAMVNDKVMLETFAASGVLVDKPSLMSLYIKQKYHLLLDSPEPVAYEYVRFGWKANGRFLTYAGLLNTETGVYEKSFRSKYLQSLSNMHGGQKGDLNGWVQALRVYDSPVLIPLLIPTLLSLASPLLCRLHEKDVGIYSLWGATNSGKSTAAEFAQSVWGEPQRQHLTAGTSAVSILNSLTHFHHLPVSIDEVTTMHPSDMQQLVFSITQGKEKTRMTAAALPIPPGTWQNTVTCTTNESVVEMLSTARQQAQAEVSRVFEVKHDHYDEALVEPIDKAIAQLREHHGVFGPRFLLQFKSREAEYRTLYAGLKQHMGRLMAMEPSAQRQSLRFRIAIAASCVMAHSIAREVHKDFPHETNALTRWFSGSIAQATKAGTQSIAAGSQIPDDLLSAAADMVVTLDWLERVGTPPNSQLQDYIIQHEGNYYFNRAALGYIGLRGQREQRKILVDWRARGYLLGKGDRLEVQPRFDIRIGGVDMKRPRMIGLRGSAVSVLINEPHLRVVGDSYAEEA